MAETTSTHRWRWERARFPEVLRDNTHVLAVIALVVAGAVVVLESTGDRADVTSVELASAGLIVGFVVGFKLAGRTDRRRARSRADEQLFHAVTKLHHAADANDAAFAIDEGAGSVGLADLALTFIRSEPGGNVFRNVNPAPAPLPRHIEIDGSTESSGVVLAAEAGEPLFVADATSDARVSQRLVRASGIRSALFIPVHGCSGVLGTIVVGWKQPRRQVEPFTERALGALAREAGIVLDRHQRSATIQHDADVDPLTGLANRRALDTQLAGLRTGDAVIALDLDHFKRVNDEYGHAAGDEVLVGFAASMIGSCRDDDFCGRMGGEEFLMVLRKAGRDGSLGVLARLREDWISRDPLATFSAGVAVHEVGLAVSQTLARADEALYDAKANGRNRTELFRTETAPRMTNRARDRRLLTEPGWTSTRAGGANVKLLVVEDDPIDLAMLEQLLAQVQPACAVSVVGTVESALQCVEAGEIDCVLLDLGLPDAEGFQALRRLRAASAELPVVVLTGRSDIETGHAAIAAGAHDVLVKGQSTGNQILRATLWAIDRAAIGLSPSPSSTL
jgi:diguanylate cyclase (GGDEF)-like protein